MCKGMQRVKYDSVEGSRHERTAGPSGIIAHKCGWLGQLWDRDELEGRRGGGLECAKFWNLGLGF